jgi:transposase
VPLTALLLPGQAHESTQFEDVLDGVRVPQRQGRPRCRPKRLAADRASSAQRIRHWLRRHRITAVIPPKKPRGKPRPGRPIRYNADHYRGRNVVERCVGWLKECRALATRYEKLALNYLGLVKLAMIERYLRLLWHCQTEPSQWMY